MTNQKFSLGDFSGSDFGSAQLTNVEFREGLKLADSVFKGTVMVDVSFSDNGATGDFSGMVFNDVEISRSQSSSSFNGFAYLDMSNGWIIESFLSDTSLRGISATDLRLFDNESTGVASWSEFELTGGMIQWFEADQLSLYDVNFNGVDIDQFVVTEGRSVHLANFRDARLHNLKWAVVNPLSDGFHGVLFEDLEIGFISIDGNVGSTEADGVVHKTTFRRVNGGYPGTGSSSSIECGHQINSSQCEAGFECDAYGNCRRFCDSDAECGLDLFGVQQTCFGGLCYDRYRSPSDGSLSELTPGSILIENGAVNDIVFEEVSDLSLYFRDNPVVNGQFENVNLNALTFDGVELGYVGELQILNSTIDLLRVINNAVLRPMTVTKSNVFFSFSNEGVGSLVIDLSPSTRPNIKCGSRLGQCDGATCVPMEANTFDNIEVLPGGEIDLRGVCDLPADWEDRDLTDFRICAVAQQTWTGNPAVEACPTIRCPDHAFCR